MERPNSMGMDSIGVLLCTWSCIFSSDSIAIFIFFHWFMWTFSDLSNVFSNINWEIKQNFKIKEKSKSRNDFVRIDPFSHNGKKVLRRNIEICITANDYFILSVYSIIPWTYTATWSQFSYYAMWLHYHAVFFKSIWFEENLLLWMQPKFL